jgi:CheY-like chemotaxis protein
MARNENPCVVPGPKERLNPIMAHGTILHVEDDSNDVLLFQHACRKIDGDLRVTSASDGDEAIAFLKGAGTRHSRSPHPVPDLVLLDLKMPRLNGFEVLSWIRNEESCRRVPVVVLTSSNHQADIKRAYDLGANSYLVKPVSFDGLVSVAQMLHRYWLELNMRSEP